MSNKAEIRLEMKGPPSGPGFLPTVPPVSTLTVNLCSVVKPPAKLTPLTLMSVSDTEVELSFGSSSRSDVTYEIKYREIGVCEVLIPLTETDCNSHTITNLIPSTEYEFSVSIKVEGQAATDLGRVKIQTEMAVVRKCCVCVIVYKLHQGVFLYFNSAFICPVLLPHDALLCKARYCDRILSLCPSVRPSMTFRYRDHIGWNSSKIISRPNSLRPLLCLTPIWAIWYNGNTPKIWAE